MDFEYQSNQCFPQTYEEGRQWFQRAVKQRNGSLKSFVHPDETGPDGEELAIDFAWFGAAEADRLYISICGTHGQEYFCGAAGQLDWLASESCAALPANVAVCLVHAYNPYGAAYISRGNENFVDLNRNYFDPGTHIRPNSLYKELFELLFTADMNEHVMDDVMAAFYEFVENNDTQKAMTAMGGGQNTHPSGTLYCGHGDEWSTTTLRRFAHTHFTQANKVAIIDWHTGLGSFAEMTVLQELPPRSEEYRWACAWWDSPEAHAKLQATEARPDYVGNVNDGLANDLRAADAIVANTVIEMGTFGNQGVLAALLIDRWLRFECVDRDAPKAVELRTKMLERLNPSMPEWRAMVLAKMRLVYTNTITGLEHWE